MSEEKTKSKKGGTWRVLFWIILILFVISFLGSSDNSDELNQCEDKVYSLEDRASDYRIRIYELETEISILKNG